MRRTSQSFWNNKRIRQYRFKPIAFYDRKSGLIVTSLVHYLLPFIILLLLITKQLSTTKLRAQVLYQVRNYATPSQNFRPAISTYAHKNSAKAKI